MVINDVYHMNYQQAKMDNVKELNLGEQPLTRIMVENGLKRLDLVTHSTEQITFKMVSKACKGRRLTPHVKLKILAALNKISSHPYTMKDLFNY
jgi:hypothetical protein